MSDLLITSKAFSLSAAVVLAYDAILNLPDELEYIWFSKWSVGKVLYVAGRYPVVALFLLNEICNTLGYWYIFADVGVIILVRTWLLWIFSFPLQATLSLRTLAIWGRDWKAAIVLGVGAAIYNISVPASYVLLSIKNQPGLQGSIVELDALMKLGFISLMFYDGVMFILILIRTVHEGQKTRAKILTILFRDGVIYYAVILALNAANLSVANLTSEFDITMVGPLAPTLLAAQSIGASHIILNLRKHAYATHALPSIHLSSIRYQERRTILDEFTRTNPADGPLVIDGDE